MEEKTLARLFVKRVDQYGDRIRFMEKKNGQWRPVTFRALGLEVKEISLGLRALEIQKGERVCLMAGVRREWFACDWAIICAGALTVPIYPNDAPTQAAGIMKHSRARWAIIENMDMLDRIMSNPELPDNLDRIIVLDSPGTASNKPVIHIDMLRKMGREYESSHPDAFNHNVDAIGPEDELTIIYTSGTTGIPKGVVTTHANYMFMVEAVDRAFPLKSNDSNLHILPPAHAYGRLEHFFGHHKGITTWIAEGLGSVAENLLDARPTFLLSVPRLFEKAYTRIMAEGRDGSALRKAVFNWAVGVGKRVSRCLQQGRDIPPLLRIQHIAARFLVFRKVHNLMGERLRFAVVGAAPTSRQVLEFFHACGLLILEGWGMTETSTVGAVNRLDRFKFGTIGTPLPGVEMAVAPDGEILLKGPNRFQYYYRDPEATAAAIDEEGWLHTGDVGYMNPDGFFTITDRKKNLIITAGGKNISPQKIENLLCGNALISHAMVCGDRRKHLTALFTLNEADARSCAQQNGIPHSSVKELASHPVIVRLVREWVEKVNASLASYETVKDFRIVPHEFSIDGGELTPTLKIRRRNVIRRYRDLLDGMYDEKFVDSG
ncbi:MAG: long-chain fatty acid--CoA ligase [Deltaproteobacteria bacterium]|nr:long-chain fatty acid--CoA ligase [Deltaproteobacteria bacterium]